MKRLYKVPDKGKISGVCQGISEYLNIDVTVIRLLWIIFTFCSFGAGIAGYIACIFIMPNKDDIIKNSANDSNNLY